MKNKLNNSLILCEYDNSNANKSMNFANGDTNIKEKYRFGQPSNQSMINNNNNNNLNRSQLNDSFNLSTNQFDSTKDYKITEVSHLFESSNQQFLYFYLFQIKIVNMDKQHYFLRIQPIFENQSLHI